MFKEKIYSLSEASRVIGCHLSTLQKRRKKGKLEGVQTLEVGNSHVVMLPASVVEKLRIEFEQKRNAKKDDKYD